VENAADLIGGVNPTADPVLASRSTRQTAQISDS
jgi:hypothetical protein